MRTSPARAPKSLLAASDGACARRAAFALPPQLLCGCVASWVYTATYFCKDSIALVSIAKRPLPACIEDVTFISVGANPHPSQVSWTHDSPPSHLMPGCTHTHAAPLRRRPALRLYHTHRRRHRRSLRSFTHAPARSRYCHLARRHRHRRSLRSFTPLSRHAPAAT